MNATPAGDDAGNKVLIQYSGTDTAALMNEAQRGCSIHGKFAEGPISTRCWNATQYSCLGYEYLFLERCGQK